MDHNPAPFQRQLVYPHFQRLLVYPPFWREWMLSLHGLAAQDSQELMQWLGLGQK